jgi:hypothetical protein
MRKMLIKNPDFGSIRCLSWKLGDTEASGGGGNLQTTITLATPLRSPAPNVLTL